MFPTGRGGFARSYRPDRKHAAITHSLAFHVQLSSTTYGRPTTVASVTGERRIGCARTSLLVPKFLTYVQCLLHGVPPRQEENGNPGLPDWEKFKCSKSWIKSGCGDRLHVAREAPVQHKPDSLHDAIAIWGSAMPATPLRCAQFVRSAPPTISVRPDRRGGRRAPPAHRSCCVALARATVSILGVRSANAL